MYSKRISEILKEVKELSLKETIEFIERIQPLLNAYNELNHFMESEPKIHW